MSCASRIIPNGLDANRSRLLACPVVSAHARAPGSGREHAVVHSLLLLVYHGFHAIANLVIVLRDYWKSC